MKIFLKREQLPFPTMKLPKPKTLSVQAAQVVQTPISMLRSEVMFDQDLDPACNLLMIVLDNFVFNSL